MISPTHNANGRKGAHLAGVKKLSIEPLRACGMVNAIEPRVAANGSCNSVFRYPSPFGWFCGVPAESPDFLRVLCGKNALTCAGAARCCTIAEDPAADVGRAEGTGLCRQRNWRWRLQQPLASRPVAIRSASKQQLARARVRLAQRWSTAISSPARLSRAVQTSPIARSTQRNADRGFASLNSLTASPSAEEHKPSSRKSAAVAFLLPMPVDVTAGQDQEGR